MTSQIMCSIKSMLKSSFNYIQPNFRSGDTLAVYYNILSKGKVLEKKIEGVCIRVTKSSFLIKSKNRSADAEYNFSLFMPTRVEIVTCGKLRQARPYYWRKLFEISGKKAKIRTDFKREQKRLKAFSAQQKSKQVTA